jgi:DnaK suppressor protein
MENQDLVSIKQKLFARREELLADVESSEGATKTVELDQSRVGRLSRMDAMQAQAMSQEVKRRRELELQRISIALASVEAGDYGYCRNCDEEISAGRLEFDPSTPLCLKCAESKE